MLLRRVSAAASHAVWRQGFTAPARLASRAASSGTQNPLSRPKNILSIQSHVVHGHAGNSAAVFPMQRCGVAVWPLHTVQFSNHTQYPEGFRGMRIPPEQVAEIADGLAGIGKLRHCDAVLSGYLGSEEQGAEILDLVRRVKEANPAALYCCDPVMGHPDKGCIVTDGVTEFFRDHALKVADVICPNVFELQLLTGVEIRSFQDVVGAARALLARGPKFVLVKHLGRIGARSTKSGEAAQFEMLLATADGGSCSYPGQVFHIGRPLLDFAKEPVGAGDLTSGLFIANLVKGERPKVALEHTTSAVCAVMDVTFALRSYELQLVAAQDEIAEPTKRFVAEEIILRGH